MQFLQAVENAIREGVIYWHAFPFNGQLEIMDEPLIRSSIHMTHKLDKDFGYLPKITLSQVGTSFLPRTLLFIGSVFLACICTTLDYSVHACWLCMNFLID